MKLKDFMLTKISQTEKNKNIVRFYLDKIFRIGKFREVKKGEQKCQQLRHEEELVYRV